MNTSFWDLFWTTGMPEAWLMSRDGPGPSQAADGLGTEGTAGPLANFQPRLSDNVLVSPRGLT